MFLLDTNVVSELRKPRRADANVVAWVSSVPVSTLFISAITIFELDLGVRLLERRDAKQGRLVRAWFDGSVLPTFANRVISIDTDVALECARLHVPDPRSDRDALIAASALVHHLTVVTRNTADFQATGVALRNPWLPG